MAAGTTFKVAAIFQAFDKMSAPIRSINTRLNAFSKRMKVTQGVVRKSSSGITGSIKNITAGMLGASVAFAIWDRLILGTIRRGAELEDTLVRAGAKFGKAAGVTQNTAEFKKLENAALKAGLTTEFTANQSAEALLKLGAAGLTLEQAISTLPLVADFATASGLDIARATSISADAVGALGANIKDLSPKDLKAKMAEVNDIMVITANTYNTSVEEMFEATTKGGRVLTTLIGASGFQFAAFVGEAANVGLKAEVAGTGIRAAFLRIVSGVPQAKKAMRSLGVRIVDNNGKMRDAISILSDIRVGLSKVKDESKKTAIMQQLFGRVGINVMSTLLARTEKQLRSSTAAMAAQRGEVRRIALLIRDTLLGKWKKFMSLMEGLGLIIFTKLKPGLKVVVDFMTRAAKAVEGAQDPLVGMVILITKIILITKAWAITQAILNAVFMKNPLVAFITLLLILTTMYPDLTSKVLQFSDTIVILTIAMVALNLATKAYAFFTGTLTGALILVRIALMAKATWLGIVTVATWLANTAMVQLAISVIAATWPFVLLVLAIAAVVAAIIGLIVFWDEIIEVLRTNWFTKFFLIKPFEDFIIILKKILPEAITSVLRDVKAKFKNVFSGVRGFFKSDDKDIALNKNVNFSDVGGAGNVAPSPSVVAAGHIDGKIDVRFHNKPPEVSVDKRIASDADLELLDSVD